MSVHSDMESNEEELASEIIEVNDSELSEIEAQQIEMT